METPDSEAQLKAAQKRIQALEEANAKAEAASREAAPPRATGGSADWDQIADMPTNAHALVGNTAE